MLTRRHLFKTGIVSSILLGTGLSIQRSFDFSSHSEFSFFDAEDVKILKKFSRVIFADNLVKDKHNLILNIETAVLGLAPVVQEEIKELLLLFKWRPLRWCMGRNTSWEYATDQEVSELFERLKFHQWSLMRSAYSALTELMHAAYYSSKEAWPAIGYPGPPELER